MLVGIDVLGLGLSARIELPLPAHELDLSPDGSRAAVSFAGNGSVGLIELTSKTIAAVAPAGASAGPLLYRSDGLMLLVGDPSGRAMNILEAVDGRLVVRLPLAVRPENLCVAGGGGQVFVSGEGIDAVAVVYPYQSQVAATIPAGKEPNYLAASGDTLLVTNPSSGDVTVLDILTSQAIAVIPVGRDPRFVTFTPDGGYALVLNRESGDMAVIRMASLAGRRGRLAPLFTMFPVGSGPVSAAVRSV